ncbi:MAG TPA: hypothetical protein VFW33_23300 [Gemmataceae bacterium]|nr:hypothetical protein [Gemmataceae bacterium]
MPTQFSRLLRPPALGQADPLAEKLKRRDPDAEREIARRYNRKIADQNRTIPEPPAGGSYDTYDPRLLALLWVLADNFHALTALARRLGLPEPAAPDYAAISTDLLARLWDLGRDGTALERLWQRRGLLPIDVGPDTPENVVGFLAWRQHPGAWDELLRRYALFDIQLCADDDKEYPRAEASLLERFRLRRVPRACQSAREFAGVAAAKLLHLVPLWDYVAYSSIEHMLVKASHNELRDMGRAGRRRPALSTDEVPEAADPPRAAAAGGAEVQDALARLPVEERVVRKAQNGLDLADDEIDWAARRNLAARAAGPTAENVAVEREAVARWLADNRSPTGDHLSKIFPWYKPTQFGKASRLARLRLLLDEAERYLDRLAAAAPAEVAALRRRVRRGMDELLRRTASGNRPGKKGRPGPVASFEEWDEASRGLLHRVGGRALDRREADAFTRLRDTFALFAEQFPVLGKLAACRRLARLVPAADGLAAWLDAGQQWLSSLHEEDREKCRAFAAALGAGAGPGAPQLLLAWLGSTQQPGPAEARLTCADRAWHLSREREELAEPADALAEFARAGKWPAAAEAAGQMLRRLGRAPAVCWSAECELRACLERLRAGRRDLPARLDACRRLITHLRENDPSVPADWSARLEAMDGDAEDAALHDEVIARTVVPGAAPALDLLALWLRPAAESRFAERALKDLTALWSLTHDPWYAWPSGVPPEVAGLIAAAREGDWPRMADGAARLLRAGTDLSGVSRSAGEEFRAALQRLAQRRGQRSRPRRASQP